MSRTRRVSMEQWAGRVTAWQRSGLSAAEFAAQRGWDAAQLRWWRWKLERSGVLPTGNHEGLAAAPATGTQPNFLRLIARGDEPAPIAATAAPALAELVLRDGRTLRFDDTMTPARLCALAEALEARS